MARLTIALLAFGILEAFETGLLVGWLAGWLTGGWLRAGWLYKRKNVANPIRLNKLKFPRNFYHGGRQSTKNQTTYFKAPGF